MARPGDSTCSLIYLPPLIRRMLYVSWLLTHLARAIMSSLHSSGGIIQASSTNDTFTAISLNHIVAVYKLDDGRPYFSVEVAHLDQDRAAAISGKISRLSIRQK